MNNPAGRVKAGKNQGIGMGKKQNGRNYSDTEKRAFNTLQRMSPKARAAYVKKVANSPEKIPGYKNAVQQVCRSKPGWFGRSVKMNVPKSSNVSKSKPSKEAWVNAQIRNDMNWDSETYRLMEENRIGMISDKERRELVKRHVSKEYDKIYG